MKDVLGVVSHLLNLCEEC